MVKRICTALTLSLLPMLAASSAPLVMMVVHRPPYLVVGADGQFSGISVTPVMAALKKAGIAVQWEQVPALRQLQRLKDNRTSACSVGWYQTPEREGFAKFSAPVSQDSPWAAFANAALMVPPKLTVKALLADEHVTVLLKTGFVYGSYLDGQIAAMKAQRKETNGDMLQVLQMVAFGRAQVTFAPQEELQYYMDRRLIGGAGSKIITFHEMPDGYSRHLMCSKRVDDALLHKFNAALAAP